MRVTADRCYRSRSTVENDSEGEDADVLFCVEKYTTNAQPPSAPQQFLTSYSSTEHVFYVPCSVPWRRFPVRIIEPGSDAHVALSALINTGLQHNLHTDHTGSVYRGHGNSSLEQNCLHQPHALSGFLTQNMTSFTVNVKHSYKYAPFLMEYT